VAWMDDLNEREATFRRRQTRRLRWPVLEMPPRGGLLGPSRFRLAGHVRVDVGWVGEACGRRDLAGLTAQRLTRAARAHVPKPTRRSACTHVSRAMQAARRSAVFDFTSRLGRRTEAGPRRVLPRVRRHALH